MTTASGPRSPAPRRRLPFTLYILAGLMLLKAALLFGLVLGAQLEALRPLIGMSASPELIASVRATPGLSKLIAAFASLLVISVLGILSRRRIGWLLAMVITGLFVAIDIFGFVTSSANYVWMLLNILTVFYLNQTDVREVVGAATSLTADADQAEDQA